MSAATRLKISVGLAEQIRVHGSQTYPHECCGALLGRDTDGEPDGARDISGLFPLPNRSEDSPRNRFSITAEDVREAEGAAQTEGLEVVGWYHSHPNHAARPSEFDHQHAWPWYSYIIVSIRNGSPAELTSWRLNDDREAYSQETVEIHDRATA